MPIEHPSYRVNALSADSIGDVIEIGANDHEIEIPRVDSALAKALVVDGANPWYSTDGCCLFSKDGATLLRCLTHVERYELPAACTEIDDEAFAYNTVIRHVTFNDGLARIGDRAFICSTLDSIDIPASVQSIGEEAFAEGKNLRSAELAEGVLELGDGAFAQCAKLVSICIPASVAHIGNHVFSQCGSLRAHGEGCGLAIARGNKRYFIDESGVLYRRGENGLTLMEALDQVHGAYAVPEGTVRILERAFAFNRRLTAVSLPSSLRSIGKRAFLECESLSFADLPEGVEEIGAEAFYHSALETITLPASLKSLGPASLIVNIIVNEQSPQTGVGGRGATDFYQTALSGKLQEVTIPRFDVKVAPGNTRYKLVEGFLCEYPEDGGPLQAVQFVGGGPVAIIPRDITCVAEYALFGIDKLRELHLHTGIEHIGHSGLSVSYPLDLIEIDDGADVPVRLYPAPNSSGTVAQRKAFRAGWLDLELLVKDCDSSLSFMRPGHERTRRMLLRLVNGRRLTDRFEREFTRTVQVCLDELVGQFARIDNRQGIRDLLDLGFIDAASIAHAIEVANRAKGVACARLLLEEKRTRFPDRTFDFDI